MARWQTVVMTTVALSMLALAALASLPAVDAIAVSPTRQQLPSPSEQTYQFVYSITNDGPAPTTLTLRPERFSAYLAERVTFSKEQFALAPGQTENIQLSFSPGGLGPETHTLTIGVYEGTTRHATFELLTTVPGTPVENYDLTIAVEDVTSKNLVPVEVTLRNLGNVVGYARPILEIVATDGTIIGSVEHPEPIQVVPGATETFILPFTQELEPGFYTARVTAAFPLESIDAEKPFSVALGETRQTIRVGEDLIISFASMGNPPSVQYVLLDDARREVAAGTHETSAGDLVVRTSELRAGTYTLDLVIRGQTQSRTVVIRDEGATMRTALAIVAGIIVLVALWSARTMIALRIKLARLRWAVSRREREVHNLINRAHRLVDEYAAHAARHRERDSSPGTPHQGA